MSPMKVKDNISSQDRASVKNGVLPALPNDINLKNKINFHFRKNYPQKNSEILSSQYGINIFLAGLFLMFADSLNIIGITKKEILCFLTTLMLIQLIWMFWYILISKRDQECNQEKDSHAGARWLRCGIALFAVISLLQDGFKLGYYMGYSVCLPVAEAVFPVTHAAHSLVQVYFLWFHSKDIIQSFKTLERFGLIHSVFTNLLLWASEVFTESKHQLVEHMARLSTLGFENITIETTLPTCNCTTAICSTFAKGIYYLYPFNIEYHILASAMLYVLWKNIGNQIKHHQQKTTFNFDGIAIGSVLGLTVLASTIGIIAMYFLHIGYSKSNSELALSVYYFYVAVLLTAMCIAATVGLLIYRTENRTLVDAKSPSLKLDTELLVTSACGSWLIAWGSILAIICADGHPVYTWYNLPYSILVILEKYIQNLFIIESIHRKEETPSDEDAQTIESVTTQSSESPLFPDPPFPDPPFPEPPLENISNDIYIVDNQGFPPIDTIKVFFEEGGRDVGSKNQQHDFLGSPAFQCFSNTAHFKELNKRRRILRNIAVFLFLCNISLWIPPAFGCRPQYDNGLEEKVFGFRPWIILIDIAIPFSIFYRMHSAYSLFDVYCKI